MFGVQHVFVCLRLCVCVCEYHMSDNEVLCIVQDIIAMNVVLPG